MNFVAAILYAVSSSALLAVALAFAWGGLDPFSAGTALSFGALVAADGVLAHLLSQSA